MSLSWCATGTNSEPLLVSSLHNFYVCITPFFPFYATRGRKKNHEIYYYTSITSMASTFFSALSLDNGRPDPASIRGVLVSVNEYVAKFSADSKCWDSLKSKCISLLNAEKQEFFEFSEHSTLSNLYWGIESIEAAIQAKWSEERISNLKNAETSLQVPALLDEHGSTAGIDNQYLVCCSYFCLSVVRKLQNNEWQVAQDFLQAMLVSPRLVRTEFASEFCGTLFSSTTTVSALDTNEDSFDEYIREIAGKAKHWLMYYRIMFNGETPPRSRIKLKSPDEKSQPFSHLVRGSSDCSNRIEHTCHNYEKVYPLDSLEHVADYTTNEHTTGREIQELESFNKTREYVDQVHKLNVQSNDLKMRASSIKCLQEVLMEYQSDTSTSVSSSCGYYLEEGDIEVSRDEMESITETARRSEYDTLMELNDQLSSKLQAFVQCLISMLLHTQHQIASLNLKFDLIRKFREPFSSMDSMFTTMILQQAPSYSTHGEAFHSSVNELDFSLMETGDERLDSLCNFHLEDRSSLRVSRVRKANFSDQVASSALKSYRFASTDCESGCMGREKDKSYSQRNFNELFLHSKRDSTTQLMEKMRDAISKLCFSEGLARGVEDYAVEVTTIYEMLNNKRGEKYSMLKDVILDQLLTAISTSKEERVIRASVSILTTIISVNKSAVEDIKKKGLQLCDLATALKQNVHEAAILIYLINPSPTEIKTLELLPSLVEVVCTSRSYNGKPESLNLTPPTASLMMIEVLVTAFDCATNNKHLAAINSPDVLSGLANIAGNNNQEEFVSLATILVKCMQFDGQCRKNVSQCVPVAPFMSLLKSNDNRAKFAALEFFHEILRMPRSAAISLLQCVRKEGSADFMKRLMHCVEELQHEYKLLAANLLLQLDVLENPSSKGVKESALSIIIKALVSEESSTTQELASFILANIGGTYSWTGEPYTVAWLVKKAGLTSFRHRNMIRNFDWLDESLKDEGIELWSSKIAKVIIDGGKPVFRALEKGLMSKVKRVSRDCLTVIAWIGCEIAKYPNSTRYSTSKILLSGIEQFLHPGLELEERLLACLCIYNNASGRGMQKLIHFSEGVRESLRRFSSVTWMAEELHRAADYYLPNKSASHNSNGAVTALIYYRGLLFSGYSDGSIKVWEIRQQSATIVWDAKEHKKAVTCFSLFGAGDSLLSGSADKTVKIWKMVHKKLDCVEVIDMKEPLQELETYGEMIFAITQSHRLKMLDASRTVKDICKAKKVKCMSMLQGRVYIGCLDSSIQEFSTASNKVREIKASTKSWMMQHKPIHSIIVYKDWLYSAGSIVEGSKVKDWRTQSKPQMSITTEKGRNVQALEVVEDFIYLHCSSSTNSLQIWLRGTQQKVGRISAGSKITSILTANDLILCGTEKGLIKGWIPL